MKRLSNTGLTKCKTKPWPLSLFLSSSVVILGPLRQKKLQFCWLTMSKTSSCFHLMFHHSFPISSQFNFRSSSANVLLWFSRSLNVHKLEWEALVELSGYHPIILLVLLCFLHGNVIVFIVFRILLLLWAFRKTRNGISISRGVSWETAQLENRFDEV